MKIQKKGSNHGVALTQIVEHPSFKALNKADEKFGHYQINHDTRILIRYRSGNSPWTFTLKEEDINILIEDITYNQRSFLCLVCGNESICVLSCNDYQDLIDTSKKSTQSIIVELPPRSSMHVKSKIRKLDHAIPHKNFPDILFR